MERRLIISFEQLSELGFQSRVQQIISAMGRDRALVYFPEPWVGVGFSLEVLREEFAEYEAVKSKADAGSKMARPGRDALRAKLSERLKRLAIYLEMKAQGNVAMLEATGYAVTRERGPRTSVPPAPPQMVAVRRGVHEDSLVVRCRASKTAWSYEVELCDGDPSIAGNWRVFGIMTDPKRFVMSGLTPGVLYYVRLRGINGIGPGGWSDLASMRAG